MGKAKPRGIHKGKAAPRSEEKPKPPPFGSDRHIRDLVASKFSALFEYYDYESEDDVEKGEDIENIESYREDRDAMRSMTIEEMLEVVEKELANTTARANASVEATQRKVKKQYEGIMAAREREFEKELLELREAFARAQGTV
jgi:hypothetical protein